MEREPDYGSGEIGRDRFNEKPTREEQMAVTGYINIFLFLAIVSETPYLVFIH